jgi:hypothetical protein
VTNEGIGHLRKLSHMTYHIGSGQNYASHTYEELPHKPSCMGPDAMERVPPPGTLKINAGASFCVVMIDQGRFSQIHEMRLTNL